MATKADARKAEADAKSAEANARALEAKAKADAQASSAAAEIAKIQAETEARKAESERQMRAETTAAEQRKTDAARIAADEERKRQEALSPAVSSAINVAAPVAGIVAGHAIASKIEGRHTSTRAVANKELQKLGNSATKLLKAVKLSPVASQKLAAIVTAADKMALTKVKGPVGVVPAAILLAEGAYSRFILAEKVENPAVKEAVRAVGTTSAFAATSLVGERLLHNSTPKTAPNANALAKIEAARTMTTPAAEKTVAKVATSAVVRQTVGKFLVRAVPVVGGLIYAKGIVDAAIDGGAKDGAKGAAFDAANAATLGLMGLVVDRGKLVGQAQAAAAASSAKMTEAGTRAQPIAMDTPVADGMVEGHTRVQNGKLVKVQEYRRSP